MYKPSSKAEFEKLNNELASRRFVAIDALKPGLVRSLTLGEKDPSINGAQDMASCIGNGGWSNGPLSRVAWGFDSRTESVKPVTGKDGKPLGLGYVEWGPGNCIPSTIPPLAMSLPYTAAPLRYIADLTAGLGPRLMYRFPDGTLTEYRDAGYKLLMQIEKERKNDDSTPLLGRYDDEPRPTTGQEAKVVFLGNYVRTDAGIMTVAEAEELQLEPRGISQMPRNLGPEYWTKLYAEWERTWLGYDETDELGIKTHIPGAKEFIEENNLDLHLSQCMQDNVMLDIYFPTVGFNTWGRRNEWKPKVTRVGVLEAHSTRLSKQDERRHINSVYYSTQWRTLGASGTHTVASTTEEQKIVMYQAAMPQHLLSELHYIVASHQRGRIKERPMWVVCPTFYPSMNKPYYPQPAWWSVFTSKAFDFSSTILYDKAKQRENSTSWGKLFFISLDYLDSVFSDEGYQGNKEAQQKFIDDLEKSMEEFLQHRENHGKMMRQWMWTGQDGKEHHNVEIVDIADATKDEASAGKEELELSTSPIFLALQVDPRLVGVPMVAASNGGTALREMALLKQQQLSVHQRLYLSWLNTSVCTFNGWDNAEFMIKQQTLTTLDNSKTGIIETISGESA